MTAQLTVRPSVYLNEALARNAAAESRKGWLVRATTSFDAVPRFGDRSRPTHCPDGAWLVVLPVDAGKLESAGLATFIR